jgi:hypothetical protein
MAKQNTGASARAKAYGLGSLSEVVRMTQLSRKALETWYTTRPELFEIVLKGCAAVKGGGALKHLAAIQHEAAAMTQLSDNMRERAAHLNEAFRSMEEYNLSMERLGNLVSES